MKRCWISCLLSLALSAAASTTHAQQEEWLQMGYKASHFQFEVPPGFNLVQKANTGQGALFTRSDGASLSVWGAELPRQAFRAQMATQMKQDRTDGWKITYTRVTDTWASYSGIRSGKIRYFRAISVCGNRAAVFVLDYDRSDKLEFDPIVTRLVRTFKSDGC